MVLVIATAFHQFNAMSPVRGQSVKELPKAIWYILKARDSKMWFGSPEEGLYCANGKTITKFTTRDGLPSNHISDIKEDKHGGILIVTAKGVSRFDGEVFKTLTPVLSTWTGKGWKLNTDDVWLRGKDQGGPYRYDGKTLFDLRFPALKNNANSPSDSNVVGPPDAVYTVFKDLHGDVWFGLASLGIYRYNGRSLDHYYQKDLTDIPNGGSIGIRAILQDRSGNFWFSNNQNRFQIPPNKSPRNSVVDIKLKKLPGMPLANGSSSPIYAQSMVEDRSGNIWLATHKKGLWRYNGHQLTKFPVTHNGREILLFSMTVDSNGTLWLGTHEDGAYRFNGKSFEQFPTKK